MIDSFIGNRNLGVVFEVRMGKGRLLITSLDLSSDLETRHAARQLRHSLASYVDSDAFDPTVECTPDALTALIVLHQQEPIKKSRDEIKARFDRIVE